MDVEDTLVLILERIDSSISLIRAASTCRRWRRIIADAGFLRRYRSLHRRPPVAGDYYNGDYKDGEDGRVDSRQYDPSFVPSSSIDIDTRHFSLDFVVGANKVVLDSRGSLLLMDCSDPDVMSRAFPEFVVCEPLTQRYKIIPSPLHIDRAKYSLSWGPFLVDGDEDAAGGRIGMSNFRVLCMFFNCTGNDDDDDDDDAAYTTMFTATGGDMPVGKWSEKVIDNVASRLHPKFMSTYGAAHVLGSWYIHAEQDRTLITHDGSTGKFSSLVLPQAIKNCWDCYRWLENFSVVDGGDGEPRIVTILDHTMDVFARDEDGEWGLENKVLLSKITCSLPGYQPSFFDRPLTILKTGVGFVVISKWQRGRYHWPFSVDLRTMEVAPAAKGRSGEISYPCEFPWPPVLQVCLDR